MNANYPTPKPHNLWRSRFPLLLSFVGILSVVVALVLFGAYSHYKSQSETRPVVMIRDPQFGDQLKIGQATTVRAQASDESKIIRLELWVDDQLHETQTSNSPGGISPFPMLTDWQPLIAGSHTLTVRAFNSQGQRAYSSVIVEAIEIVDQDQDGVDDESDACPDQIGSAFARGCPDAEGDGIPDAEDACPLEYGLALGDGCPVPSEGDRDGDGTLDHADACADEAGSPFAEGCPDADSDGMGDDKDACPTEAGWPHPDGCPVPGDMDGDSLPDTEDACPHGWGLPEHEGCPDDDSDGIPDYEDADPGEAGPGSSAGAPDRDRDGVPDAEDLCPDESGLPWNAGCPESRAGDRDEDGIADDVDLAPDEAGLPEHGGAPPPGEGEDADEDGIPDAEEPPDSSLFDLLPFWLGEIFIPRPVEKAIINAEIEVIEFSVLRIYDEIECYARVNDYDEILVTFRAEGENRWNLLFATGESSQTYMVDDELPIRVWMECHGYQPMLPPPEGDFDLGSFTTEHILDEWDGRVLFMNAPGHVDSTPGDSGHGFQIQYRICAGSCAESPLRAPVLTWFQVSSGPSIDYQMRWTWDGNVDDIDGFMVFRICENHESIIYRFPTDRHQLNSREDPRFFSVPCDDRCEYFVRVYQDRGDPGSIWSAWSAPSSVYTIGADTCPQYVLVTFETLPAFDLPPDEGHENSVGPIYGEFWAEGGGRRESLTFNISDCDLIVEGRCTGLYFVADDPEALVGNRIWDDFFCAVRRTQADHPHCPIIQGYTVPDTNILAVAVMPGNDLTIGGRFMDYDSDDEDDVLFEAQLTLSPAEIADGEYALSNGTYELGIRLRLVAIPLGIRPLSCDR